jgi:Fic family protein
MEDLCRFVARADLPAVVQGAIAHAQFETIHPFVDGNGRVGRALVHIVLRRRGAVSRFVPPVSLVLLANGQTYVDGLTMYRAGEVAAWSTRFAHALIDSVALAATLGRQLHELQEQWRAAAGRPRRTSATHRLIELLVARPVVDIPSVRDQLEVSYPQAREAVLRLEEAGVLRQFVLGRRRNRAWEAPSLLDLLDAFEFAAMTPTRSGEPRRTAPRPRRAPPP